MVDVPPDVIDAASYLNIHPRKLMQQSIRWVDMALVCKYATAEAEAGYKVTNSL